jgi:molybdenum cofactor biosynthesis protein MoaC
MAAETLRQVSDREIPKGDALEVARVAAIQAAKDTSRIIPFCHPLPVDFVGVEYELGVATIKVLVTVKAIYKTGVEMEALTAASVAALTLYDMLKMLDQSMLIEGIQLLSKHGGKSDFREAHIESPQAAVLVLSDRVSAGEKNDRSGRLIVDRLQAQGMHVADYKVIADDTSAAAEAMINYADNLHLDLVITAGGTGLSRRDNTPEATLGVIEREAPGIAEVIRAYGQERLPYAMLSRAVAGMRGDTLIINLPGSVGAVSDALVAIFPAVLHCLAVRHGAKHSDTYNSQETDAGA